MNRKGHAIFMILLILFIMPWLSFWLCYFIGWISKLVIGSYLVEGLALLGLTVPIEKIPLIAGCIGWVASFFAHYDTKDNN